MYNGIANESIKQVKYSEFNSILSNSIYPYIYYQKTYYIIISPYEFEVFDMDDISIGHEECQTLQRITFIDEYTILCHCETKIIKYKLDLETRTIVYLCEENRDFALHIWSPSYNLHFFTSCMMENETTIPLNTNSSFKVMNGSSYGFRKKDNDIYYDTWTEKLKPIPRIPNETTLDYDPDQYLLLTVIQDNKMWDVRFLRQPIFTSNWIHSFDGINMYHGYIFMISTTVQYISCRHLGESQFLCDYEATKHIGFQPDCPKIHDTSHWNHKVTKTTYSIVN